MKRLIISMLVSLGLLLPLSVQPALAACPTNPNSSKTQVLSGIGEAGQNGCSNTGVTNFVHAVVNIMSFVAGVAAIIAIIISGFRFMTSGGEASKVAAAKNALVYALVGVAVAALAQVFVHFV